MEFDLQNLIASVGFPITLSMYLLVRIEGKLQTLSDSINELSIFINKQYYITKNIILFSIECYILYF